MVEGRSEQPMALDQSDEALPTCAFVYQINGQSHKYMMYKEFADLVRRLIFRATVNIFCNSRVS